LQTREWVLTLAAIVVPLVVAMVVTIWSLEQVRYRPKPRRPPGVPRETLHRPPNGVVSADEEAEAPPGAWRERNRP
jgi:hypothetical protein